MNEVPLAVDSRLLDRTTLERSSVVANCAMNRARRLRGPNGYDREFGLCPLAFLRTCLATKDHVAWLDVCCGEGRAVLEAGEILSEEGFGPRITLVGVDLVGHFVRKREQPSCVQLLATSVFEFIPGNSFDLVTCCHGLHYLGDKLGLLAQARTWLTRDGLLLAQIDLRNIRDTEGRPIGRTALAHLKRARFDYDPRRRLLRAQGADMVPLPFTYVGADDRAGPNYTGQPAVHSIYRRV